MPPRQAVPSLPPLLLSAYCGSRKQWDKQPPPAAGWTDPLVCQFYLRSPVAKDPPSNGVLIFHPEFRYALKKRSLPDRCATGHTLDRTAALPKEHPGSWARGFRTAAAVPFPVVRRRRFNRQIPCRPAAWSENWGAIERADQAA